MRCFLFIVVGGLVAACSSTPATVGHISTWMPNPHGVVAFTAGDEVPLSWVCPEEDTERVMFVLFTDAEEPIMLGETTELQFYTKCSRDLAHMQARLPMQPAEGYIQGIGYRSGRITSYSHPLRVTISAE